MPDEVREHMTRSETIPSSRISPDPLYYQLHDGASSVHLTHVLQGSGQRTGMDIAEVVLGGIPVHTEYRCLFFLRYEFLKYRNTGVI